MSEPLFTKTVTTTVTIEFTSVIPSDECEAIYGVSLDALDDTVVRNMETAEDNENLLMAIYEGDWAIRDSKFVVGELTKR